MTKKQLLKEIGQAIAFWRLLAGFTEQETFARRLKVVRSYVSRIESGWAGISLMRLAEIGKILGVDLYTFLRGSPSKREQKILLDLYASPTLGITKAELEELFVSRIMGKSLTRQYYVNQLAIIRSEIYIRLT